MSRDPFAKTWGRTQDTPSGKCLGAILALERSVILVYRRSGVIACFGFTGLRTFALVPLEIFHAAVRLKACQHLVQRGVGPRACGLAEAFEGEAGNATVREPLRACAGKSGERRREIETT
jgi:hypothetical protein